jgi:hypothetical protein
VRLEHDTLEATPPLLSAETAHLAYDAEGSEGQVPFTRVDKLESHITMKRIKSPDSR